ncbi:MAG: hypothetical protein OXB95_11335 [Rhodobacteraceae bacterium]|nr:hypothetical protein [Paracoccaceae bacterium]
MKIGHPVPDRLDLNAWDMREWLPEDQLLIHGVVTPVDEFDWMALALAEHGRFRKVPNNSTMKARFLIYASATEA